MHSFRRLTQACSWLLPPWVAGHEGCLHLLRADAYRRSTWKVQIRHAKKHEQLRSNPTTVYFAKCSKTLIFPHDWNLVKALWRSTTRMGFTGIRNGLELRMTYLHSKNPLHILRKRFINYYCAPLNHQYLLPLKGTLHPIQHWEGYKKDRSNVKTARQAEGKMLQ